MKSGLARDRLPRGERRARPLGDQPGDCARPGRGRGRVGIPVERLERERDLEEVGIAGSLAHAVDRPLHPRRAGLHRRDRRGRPEPEVVVAVPCSGDVEPVEGLARQTDQGCGPREPRSRGCRRRRSPARRPRARPRMSARKESRAARDPSTPKKAIVIPCSRREGDGLLDAVEHRLAGPRRATRASRPRSGPRSPPREPKLEQSGRRRPGTAREKPQTSAPEPGRRDELDRAAVVVGDAGKAGLDAVDAGPHPAPARSRASAPGSSTTPTVCRRLAASCRTNRSARRCGSSVARSSTRPDLRSAPSPHLPEDPVREARELLRAPRR